MWKMGAMFVLLLLFTLTSSQQEGDVQARKMRSKNVFHRTMAKTTRGCEGTCYGSEETNCNGSCECSSGGECYCGYYRGSCICTCAG
uniref:Conotoxin n=1 Tax=Conus andremenezi TaxID=1077466 RepID=A0A291C225_9COND|nr:conotoxin [Conus andremenezi]